MDKVFNRKKKLILRDPAYIEFCKTFEKIRNTRESPYHRKGDLLEKYRNVYLDKEAVYKELLSVAGPHSSEKTRKKHERKYSDYWKLLKLRVTVEYKWRVSLIFDFTREEISLIPYTKDEVIWVGTPPLITGYKGVMKSDWNKYPLLNWSPFPNPFKKSPILADINEFVTPGYNKTGEKWVPIIVNVSRLNKADAKIIKKRIWSKIEENLQKGRTKKPHGEFEACSFLYSLRQEKTFENHCCPK
ncbi:MAG: hypothetical protein HY787_24885 [Deltaproteobacteria bacterium]|nr:hypothetical protein [Deltaproteobacteria bacterium]